MSLSILATFQEDVARLCAASGVDANSRTGHAPLASVGARVVRSNRRDAAAVVCPREGDFMFPHPRLHPHKFSFAP